MQICNKNVENSKLFFQLVQVCNSPFIIILKLMHLDQSEIRRNRQKFTLQLRKQTREQIFLKRRNFGGEKSMIEEIGKPNQITQSVVLDERYRDVIEQAISQNYTKQQLPAIIAELTNINPVSKHQAVIALRKIISDHQNQAIIQSVLDSGVLPIILALLKEKDFPHIQFEASWIVSNIAAGTTAQCQNVVDKGGIQLLLDLLNESHFRLNEQAIWAIGNIGGDSIKFRDYIIQKNGLGILIRLAQKSSFKSIIKRSAWAISNLCRGTPFPKYQLIKNGIVTLAKIILSQVLDDDELSDCLWAISSHCNEGQKSRIQRLVQINNFVAYLIQLCKTNHKQSVLIPALRIVGNISIGNQLHTEQILNGGVLDLLMQLYKHQKKSIRRQACWITSNICAGTTSQVRQVLAKKDLILALASMFWSQELDVKKEVCFVFKNMGHAGDKKAILELYLSLNITEGVVNLIRQDHDSQAIEIGLKSLFELLNVGAYDGGQNLILKQIESIPGCLDRLESLQHHKAPEIYEGVVKIFHHFFVLEEPPM